MVGLGLAIVLMLAIDLYRHREAHAPTTREALTESMVWVACGLLFSVVIAVAFGSAAFGEYISGYLIEKSLSVDNVFVWSMLFATLSIPVKYQHRVLFWGIFGALFLRGGLHPARHRADQQVLVGAAGVRRVPHLHGRQDHSPPRRRGRNGGDPRARRCSDGSCRSPTSSTDTSSSRGSTARRAATPLLAALFVVEVTDVIFAVDSVPAILAVSNEPFLVFASNAFAILGLRAMYFLLANAKERFHYLSHALGAS